jgi:hypothetical protein
MTTVHDGLQSSDATISAYCANTIDHMASYYFSNMGKDKPEMHNLNKVGDVRVQIIIRCSDSSYRIRPNVVVAYHLPMRLST